MARAHPSFKLLVALVATPLLALTAFAGAAGADGDDDRRGNALDLRRGAVFGMTNDAAGNQVLAYDRAPDGSLLLGGTYNTGGEGTSRIRLSSQGPVVLSKDGRHLFVANVGSRRSRSSTLAAAVSSSARSSPPVAPLPTASPSVATSSMC